MILLLLFFNWAGLTQASKNTRGRTKLLKLFKRTKPVKIKFNEYGQPIRKSASTLSNFLGLIAKNGQITPLSHKDWSLVPNTDKNLMWNIVQVWLLIFMQIPFILFVICQHVSNLWCRESLKFQKAEKDGLCCLLEKNRESSNVCWRNYTTILISLMRKE